jgi:hypothetical protein
MTPCGAELSLARMLTSAKCTNNGHSPITTIIKNGQLMLADRCVRIEKVF